jgi:hypothetical protein
MEVTGDYELKQEIFELALQTLRVVPTVDLFAHARNRKLAGFVAMEGPLAAGAVEVDAFALGWKNERPYAFPPVQLVGQVLQRIQEEGIAAIVVVPKWTSQPWWGLFREMQLITVELGMEDDVLRPGLAMTHSHVTLLISRGMFLMAVVQAVPTKPTEVGSSQQWKGTSTRRRYGL